MTEQDQAAINSFEQLASRIGDELNALKLQVAEHQRQLKRASDKAVRSKLRVPLRLLRSGEEVIHRFEQTRASLKHATVELDQSLRSERAQAQAKVEEAERGYLKALAEAENTRNRMKREERNIQRRAIRPIAENLITVADNFEKTSESIGGVAYEDEALRGLTEGVALSITSFNDALKRSGIEAYGETNTPFDPNEHEAIAMVPQPDLTEQTVIDIQRTGYKLNGELLRPVQVIVGNPVEDAATQTDAATEDTENEASS